MALVRAGVIHSPPPHANFQVCILCWKTFRKFSCSKHERADENHNEDVDNEGLENIEVVAKSEDLKDNAIANCEAVENKVVEDKAASINMKAGRPLKVLKSALESKEAAVDGPKIYDFFNSAKLLRTLRR